jgi:outer membrane immunogenic protein
MVVIKICGSNMKKALFLAAAMLFPSLASAADMAVKAPPVVPLAVYNWTGFYIGGNVGYAWGQSRTDTFLDPTSSWQIETIAFRNELVGLSNRTLNPQGVVGGLQAGYNFQSGAWVFGFEVDINAADLRRTDLSSGLNGGFITRNFTESIKTDWFATFRPRVGFAANTTLWYVTGGLAVADVKGSWQLLSSNGYNKAGSGSATKVGWTAGAGVEHAFAPNWTVKLEYLYTDLGNFSYPSVYLPGSTFAPPGFNYVERITQDFTFHTVRVGVNYKFGGPVVAKY